MGHLTIHRKFLNIRSGLNVSRARTVHPSLDVLVRPGRGEQAADAQVRGIALRSVPNMLSGGSSRDPGCGED
jgi:hypothetical protein